MWFTSCLMKMTSRVYPQSISAMPCHSVSRQCVTSGTAVANQLFVALAVQMLTETHTQTKSMYKKYIKHTHRSYYGRPILWVSLQYDDVFCVHL